MSDTDARAILAKLCRCCGLPGVDPAAELSTYIQELQKKLGAVLAQKTNLPSKEAPCVHGFAFCFACATYLMTEITIRYARCEVRESGGGVRCVRPHRHTGDHSLERTEADWGAKR